MAFTGRTSRDQNKVGLVLPGNESPGPGAYHSGGTVYQFKPSSAPFGGTSNRPMLGAPTPFVGSSSRPKRAQEGFSETPGPSRSHQPIKIKTNAALESAFMSEAPRFGMGGAMSQQHPANVTPGPGSYKLPGAIRIRDKGREVQPSYRRQGDPRRPRTTASVSRGRAGGSPQQRHLGGGAHGPATSVPGRGHRGFKEMPDGTLQQLPPRADPHGGAGPGPGVYDPVGSMRAMERGQGSRKLAGGQRTGPGGATFGADTGQRTDFSTAGLDRQLVGQGGPQGDSGHGITVPVGQGPHLAKYGSVAPRQKRRVFVPPKRPTSVFASGTRRGGALEVPRNMQCVPGPGAHYDNDSPAFNGMAMAGRPVSYQGPKGSPMQGGSPDQGGSAMFAPPRAGRPGFGGRSGRAPLSSSVDTPGPGTYDLPTSPIRAAAAARTGSPTGQGGFKMMPPSMEAAVIAAEMAAMHADDAGQKGALTGSYRPAVGGGGPTAAVLPRRTAPFGSRQARGGMAGSRHGSPDPTAYNLPTMADDMARKTAPRGVVRPPPFGCSDARFGPQSAIPDMPREEDDDGAVDDGRAQPPAQLGAGASAMLGDLGKSSLAKAGTGRPSRRRVRQPGPGQYDPHVHPSEMTEFRQRAPNAAFSSGTDRFGDLVARQMLSGGGGAAVGPGEYGVPRLAADAGKQRAGGASRGGLLGSGPRDRFQGGPMDTLGSGGRQRGVRQPGVGQYEIKSGFERARRVTQARSQLGGTGSRFTDPSMGGTSSSKRNGQGQGPGPGEYAPSTGWLRKSFNITVVNEEARQRVRESRLLSASQRGRLGTRSSYRSGPSRMGMGSSSMGSRAQTAVGGSRAGLAVGGEGTAY